MSDSATWCPTSPRCFSMPRRRPASVSPECTQDLPDAGIGIIRTRVDDDVVAAEGVHDVDEPTGPAPDAVASRALSRLENLQVADHADREHLKPVECPPPVCVH